MKKLIVFILILSLIVPALSLSGCTYFGRVTGSGNIISKLYNFTDFTEIEVSNSFQIEVVPLDLYSVSISTYENLFDYVNISQSGKTLKIGMKPLRYTNANLKVTVTLPVLDRLNMSGASHGSARGFQSTRSLKLKASGASSLDIDIEGGATEINLSGASRLTGRLLAEETTMEISGVSRVDLNGSTGNLTLKVSGASQANLPEFPLQSAEVMLSGASKSDIALNGKLDVSLSGASTLDYSGDPSLGKINISGASNLNHK